MHQVKLIWNKLDKIPDNEREDIFYFKPLWQRVLVVAAGPIANFILAIILFACVFGFAGERVAMPIVGEVMEKSAAERAGFRKNDFILAVNDKRLDSFNDLRRMMMVGHTQDFRFTIEREGKEIILIARPDYVETKDMFGNVVYHGRLGISASPCPRALGTKAEFTKTSCWESFQGDLLYHHTKPFCFMGHHHWAR